MLSVVVYTSMQYQHLCSEYEKTSEYVKIVRHKCKVFATSFFYKQEGIGGLYYSVSIVGFDIATRHNLFLN
jgi:hypothetical protein